MLHRYLVAEVLKLRRSLALLLCLAAPSFVALISTLVALRQPAPPALDKFGGSAAALWVLAMLPLTVAALSVLMAQIEHGPRTWNHLLTLPRARPHVFLAKALVMLGLVAAMSALLWLEMVGCAALVEAARSDTLKALDPARLASQLVRMTAASTLVVMLQLWIALRCRSFVPPLAIGIVGTVVSLVSTSAKEGIYFPWLMAANVLGSPERAQTALLLGGAGGLLMLGAMLAHLSAREA
jgi:ABC-2 type transport system permease protein